MQMKVMKFYSKRHSYDLSCLRAAEVFSLPVTSVIHLNSPRSSTTIIAYRPGGTPPREGKGFATPDKLVFAGNFIIVIVTFPIKVEPLINRRS